MSFVISAGQVARIQRQPSFSPAFPNYVNIGKDQYLTFEQIWRTQPAVRTVVGFLARNIAQLGLHVFERADDNDRRRRTDHPLAKLMRRPFPGTAWNSYRLISWTIHERCIYDEAFWIKGRVGDEFAVLPIPRRFIQPTGENPLMPTGYKISGSNGERDLSADQVVHFRGYNPDDMRTGCSPLETLRALLAEEYAATKYREQMWTNGARVSGYISRSEKAASWSSESRERFRREWTMLYGAGGIDAGGTPVLEDGMTFQPSGVTPRDAQYIEARKLTREEVAVAYFVPPAMLGLMDGAGAGNLPEIHRMTYQDALGPSLVELQGDIETQLLPDLDASGYLSGRIYIEFNLQEKLRGSFEAQAAAIQSSVGGPWMTRSEARGRFNLPHLDDGDDLIVPMNVTAGGLASPRDTAPNNPSNAESNGLPPGPKAPELAG